MDDFRKIEEQPEHFNFRQVLSQNGIAHWNLDPQELDQAPRLYVFSCSTQLSMKFFLLINVKMPTTVSILTFQRKKNNILGFSEPEKS